MAKRGREDGGLRDLEKQICMLADLIRESEYLVVYTGAGISTSAGIADYRGPEGVRQLRASGMPRPRRGAAPVHPTLSHMALVALQNNGKMKHLISQNTDGLHRRSGIGRDNLSELHGNTNVEICPNCGANFWRRFSTRNVLNDLNDHETTRKCKDCNDWLHDTLVNFNEPLPPNTLRTALCHSQKADVALVLGSSLRVAPAADLPLYAARDGKGLVIVNHQRTPLDKVATSRISADIDVVMEGVMKNLGYEIPPMVDFMDVIDLTEESSDKERI